MILLEGWSGNWIWLAAMVATLSTVGFMALHIKGGGRVSSLFRLAGIGIIAALSAVVFLSQDQLQSIFPGLKNKRQLISYALISLLMLYELRVISLAVLASRSQRPEADLTSSYEGKRGLAKILNFASNWEKRFWLYALMTRAPKQDSFDGTLHFGSGKQNGNASTWLGWAIVNLVPVPIIHVLLQQRSPLAAWLTTFSCLMGSVWLWAEFRAAKIRPISIDDEFFYLRYGLSTDRKIERASILDVKSSGYKDMDRALTRYVGFGAPNVVVALRDGEEIAIGVDSPGLLIEKLRPQATAVEPI